MPNNFFVCIRNTMYKIKMYNVKKRNIIKKIHRLPINSMIISSNNERYVVNTLNHYTIIIY